MATIVPVVEGPGDTVALPQLLGRILSQMHNRPDIMVAQGKTRVVTAQNRSNLEKYLEKFLRHALNKPDCAAILVLAACPRNNVLNEIRLQQSQLFRLRFY